LPDVVEGVAAPVDFVGELLTAVLAVPQPGSVRGLTVFAVAALWLRVVLVTLVVVSVLLSVVHIDPFVVPLLDLFSQRYSAWARQN
jgi:hypothetical protein